MVFIYGVVVLLFASCASSAITLEENSPCTTPNGERAKCTPINSCTVIKQAITYLDETAINFARASHCGKVNGTHLVCCGTAANFVKSTTSAPVPSTPKVLADAEVNFPIIENVRLPDRSLCGIQESRNNRIIGGTDADLEEFPWMVALKYENEVGSDAGFRCSGTLINQYYVLTAAQCLNIRNFRLVSVRLGEWKISTSTDCVPDNLHEQTCADPVVDIKVKRTVAHPFFSKNSGNNDLALIQLEDKVAYSRFIRPICLPTANYPSAQPGERLTIAGWGVTEQGRQSDTKQKVEIPVVPTSLCARIYPNSTAISNNQVCAGGEMGKDACRGDSGGPLLRRFDGAEEQWFQEAIIYRGLGCGRKGVPGLYTRLSRYVLWILREVQMTT